MVRCKHIDSQTVGTIPPLSCYTAISINGSRLAAVYNRYLHITNNYHYDKERMSALHLQAKALRVSLRYYALCRSAAPALGDRPNSDNEIRRTVEVYRSYGAYTWESKFLFCRSYSRGWSQIAFRRAGGKHIRNVWNGLSKWTDAQVNTWSPRLTPVSVRSSSITELFGKFLTLKLYGSFKIIHLIHGVCAFSLSVTRRHICKKTE